MQSLLSLLFLFLYFIILIFIAFGAIERMMRGGFIRGILLLIPILIIVFISGNIFGLILAAGLYKAMLSSVFLAFILSIYILIVKVFEYLKKLHSFNKFLSKYERERYVLSKRKDIISSLKLAELYEKVGEYEKALEIYENLKQSPEGKEINFTIERNRHNTLSYLTASKYSKKHRCKKCKKDIPLDRIFCPECGNLNYPLTPLDFIIYRLRINPKFLIIPVILFLLFILFTGIIPAITFLLMLFTLFSIIYEPFEGSSIIS